MELVCGGPGSNILTENHFVKTIKGNQLDSKGGP